MPNMIWFILTSLSLSKLARGLNLRARLVGRNLDVQSLHSARFPTVAFRLYLIIIVQPLTN